MQYDLKIFTENIEPQATNQVYTLMSQRAFANSRIRIMPDVHCGIGCVVGFTATMGVYEVIPNVIGVDIGCGMRTVNLGKEDIDLAALDEFIKKNIPSGKDFCREENGKDLIDALYVKSKLKNMPRLLGSIGSLGGGNHFIEVDVDDEGNKYLIVHTGSRNLGMQVASIYQDIAIDDCKSAAVNERNQTLQALKEQGRVADIPTELEKINKKYAYRTKIPADLCYLDDVHCSAYLHDMRICQEFARRNRERIVQKILDFLGVSGSDMFETVHNYIDDDNIIRKGAISARKGERVLIPMNMRDGCIVGIGKGNEDWNFSAPHGAGRLFSRSEAKQLFSEQEFVEQMKGIYTTTANQSTIDEAPMAYKPMAEIQQLIRPTVDIEKIIRPIYNFKAAE